MNVLLARLQKALDLCGVPNRGRVKAVYEKTGYSQGMVSKILSDKAEMGERFIKLACSAFGINEEWVLEGKEPVVAESVRVIPTRDWSGRAAITLEGDRLKEVREVLNYSQEEMADQLNTDLDTLRSFEDDLFLKDIRVLRRLALLGININWLMTGRGVMRLDNWPITITRRDGKTFNLDDLFPIRLKSQLGNRTTEWLSRESKISTDKINMLISGESIPTVNEVESMAYALRINPHWLAENNNDLLENCVYGRLRGIENSAIPAELYKAALIAVENFSAEAGLALSSEVKADVINDLCRAHLKKTTESVDIDREMVRIYVRSAT